MNQSDSSEMGMNRTGMATSPLLSKEMLESSAELSLSLASDGVTKPEQMRIDYMNRGTKVGSVPPPMSLTGIAKTTLQALKGEKAAVLVDKLAERLAFERSGTRLYEALILKCTASAEAGRDSTLQKLEHIRSEELEHFQMLWGCIEELGADPTVQTPSADISGVISQGLPKVLTDPRTTFGQCLEAIMTAELVDCEAWERLCELARGFNQPQMSDRFQRALTQEQEHQIIIRDLLSGEIRGEAGITT